jgi:hypothetical protein
LKGLLVGLMLKIIRLNSSLKYSIYMLAPSGKFVNGSKFSIKNIFFNFSQSLNSSNCLVELYSHNKTLISINSIPAPLDQKFLPNSFAYGCGWSSPDYIPLELNIKSGYYFLKIKYGNKIFWLGIIIKPKFPSTNKILVLANSNKWNAYNTWAGLDGSISLYKFLPTSYYQTHRILALEGTDGTAKTAPIVANFVHTERPNTDMNSYIAKYFSSNIKTTLFFNDHIYGEMHLPNYLDGIDKTFDVITDQDMELLKPNDLSGYSIFMMHVHPEYWSEAQLSVLNLMKRMGIGLMYLAGNGIYWKCTWIGNQMEVRKDRKKHLDGTPGGQFGELRFSDISNGKDIIKIYYSKMYSMDLNPPTPYKLFNPPEWMIQNVDISGGFIGFKNLNSRTLNSGSAGWEVDKVFNKSDLKYIIGSSPDGLSNIIWVDRDGLVGPVFAVGSIIYTGSLAVDSGIARLTLNVIRVLDMV